MESRALRLEREELLRIAGLPADYLTIILHVLSARTPDLRTEKYAGVILNC